MSKYEFTTTHKIVKTKGGTMHRSVITFQRKDKELMKPEEVMLNGTAAIEAVEKKYGPQVKTSVQLLNGRCWMTVKSMKDKTIKLQSIEDYFGNRVKEVLDKRFAEFEKVVIIVLRKPDKKSKKSIKNEKSSKTSTKKPVKESVKKTVKPQTEQKPEQKPARNLFYNTRAQKMLREKEAKV